MNPLFRVCCTALIVSAVSKGVQAEPQGAKQAAGTPSRQERFYELFEPLRSSQAALSPDGRYLAYSVRTGEKLAVVTVAVDAPTTILAKMNLGSDESATAMFSDNRENTPLTIRWMQWVTPKRLLIATNHVSAVLQYGANWRSVSGMIFGVDVDGKNSKVLLTPSNIRFILPNLRLQRSFIQNDIPDHIRPIETHAVGINVGATVFDFDPNDPNKILLQAKHLSRHRLYSLNVNDGKLSLLRDDVGEQGMVPMFDRQGVLRGGIDDTRLAQPPFNYVLGKDKLVSLGRWRSLDEIGQPSGISGFQVSPSNFLGSRSIPIGFDENPEVLYYASNVGRDTFGIYALNVKTGKPTGFTFEDPAFDAIALPKNNIPDTDRLVFDRFKRDLVGIRYESTLETTHWFRPEFQSVQDELEKCFPGKNVEIQQWDQSHTRFLALVHSVSDPGSYIVYDQTTNKAFDIVRRASWSDQRASHRTMDFSYSAKDGRKINGILTFPNLARFETVPVVVRCPSEPWQRTSLKYQAETMALAGMGFAVVQIDSAGAWGYGIKHRQAIHGGYEQLIVDDVVSSIHELSKTYRINPQRVALLGEGYGGFVALRALQLHPDKFRCAISINAPLDLANWMENDRWTKRSTLLELTRSLYGDGEKLRQAPLANHPEKITKPVFLLTYPGREGGPRSYMYLETLQFARALRRQGVPVELDEIEKDYVEPAIYEPRSSEEKSHLAELDDAFTQNLPHSQAAVYRQIEYFLNSYIYEYDVRLGPMKEIPDPVNAQ